MHKQSYTLAELASIINAEIVGDPSCEIYGLASLQNAKPGQISFLVNSRYQLVASNRYEKFLSATQASAVILSRAHSENCPTNKLIVDDPYQGYLKIAALFQTKSTFKPGVNATAQIGEGTIIADSASIGPNCVIGRNCNIGENTCIEANTVIGDNVVIGTHGRIFPNVTIYREITIGDRIIIHSGAVIGSEGFGMVRTKDGWQKIPHLGSVIIGDDVEVGANTTIDRGTVDDTILENGVKLDNLIQIAHGVVIGENTVIAACVGIAGSTHIGKNCMIGGACGISDNLVICDNVIFTGMAQVVKSINKPGVYSSGTGIMAQKNWQRSLVRFHNLDDMARKVRQLEKNKNE